ncbi:MAG TPA: carbohydrate kinase family protein [Gaiellaceae bacterium]
MRLDLAAVGDVMLDVIVPDVGPGARRHAPIRVRAGGSAVNAARAAAARGARAAVIGRVGRDPAGALIADELRRAAIEPALAVDPAAATGTVAYVGDAIVADRGANANLSPDDVPRALDARAVLVSGYVLFHADTAAAGEAALDRAKGLTCVDLASPSLARAVDADVLVGNEETIAALGGLDALAREGTIVCETRGGRGAVAARGSERASAAPTVVLARSPVGAGDVFAARFVLALVGGASLGDALSAATRG